MKQEKSNPTSGYLKLDEWTKIWREMLPKYFGYPFTDTPWEVSSQVFEREVIEFFAPLYDFDDDKRWGLITHSGSDGNNHGGGHRCLRSRTMNL